MADQMDAEVARTSATRWLCLAGLLTEMERIFEAVSRLDAYVGPPVQNEESAIVRDTRALDLRLHRLAARIDRELNRLTTERLDVDLDEKRRIVRAAQYAADPIRLEKAARVVARLLKMPAGGTSVDADVPPNALSGTSWDHNRKKRK